VLPAALLAVACAGVRPPAPAPAHATPPAISVPFLDGAAAMIAHRSRAIT